MSKKQVTFTDRLIKSFKPESKKYLRSEGNGFSIRVWPSGTKTWLYRYSFDGKIKELNFGEYPFVTLETARTKAEDARRAVKNGFDPLEVEAKKKLERLKSPTVSDLIDEYINNHAKPNKRGWAEDKRILAYDALKAWGNRKAEDISKRDVVVLLDSIVKRGSPGSANNNFKIIRKMFNYAVEKDILKISPCIGVKMPAALISKDRALSEQEIKTFWNAIDTCHISDEIKRALRLILVTGQRPGEVIGMHTNEINGRWWTIPAARSKNKRAHSIYLTDTALFLIGDMKDKSFIFPSPRSEEKSKDKRPKHIEVNAIAHAIRRNSALPVKVNGKQALNTDGSYMTINKLGIDSFTPHDLRRTANTLMASCKIIKEHRERVLNHTLEKLDGTYNLHDYDDEKQMALEALERKILSIINGTENNIVPLRIGGGNK